MTNIMKIKGYKAVITYDDEIELFRGEFLGLNGGADFYASTISELKKEGENSLQMYLDVCKEKGINPKKEYSGKLPLRLDPILHEKLVEIASAEGMSVNRFIQKTLEKNLGQHHNR
ncbi:hypothetical protein COMNV_01019 [Commensalibacter sp. Nvir]|uniref:type II toxin-antitoxin system HicB family antitoxin n=1 Tax=Commensalibacter sp. Nvir TaxID=3069817 RepID=UPI002D46C554|nr:hypothetical protein COMNV_01019 [Commensalibacter sp. Nvir]